MNIFWIFFWQDISCFATSNMASQKETFNHCNMLPWHYIVNTRVYLLSLLSLVVDNVPCSLSETRNQRAYHHIAREMNVKHTRQIYKCMTHAKSAFHVYGLMEIVFPCYDPSNQIFKLPLFKQVIEYVSTYFITFNISTYRHLNFGILSHCTIWNLSFINASKLCFISACFHFYPCSYYQVSCWAVGVT